MLSLFLNLAAMIKRMTIGYQNRESRGYGGTGIATLARDLTAAPMIRIANHFLTKSGFSIGDKVNVEYLSNSIIIKKLTK